MKKSISFQELFSPYLTLSSLTHRSLLRASATRLSFPIRTHRERERETHMPSQRYSFCVNNGRPSGHKTFVVYTRKTGSNSICLLLFLCPFPIIYFFFFFFLYSTSSSFILFSRLSIPSACKSFEGQPGPVVSTGLNSIFEIDDRSLVPIAWVLFRSLSMCYSILLFHFIFISFFHFSKVGRVCRVCTKKSVLLLISFASSSRHIRPDQGPSSGTSRCRSIAEYTRYTQIEAQSRWRLCQSFTQTKNVQKEGKGERKKIVELVDL